MRSFAWLTLALPLAFAISACQLGDSEGGLEEAGVSADVTSGTTGDALGPAGASESHAAGDDEVIPLPEDSSDYIQDRIRLENAVRAGEAYEFTYGFNLASFYNRTYPLFEELENCDFNDEGRIWCEYGRMGVPTDHEIAEHVPYLANVDVLDAELRCTSICITPDNTVIGRVQPAMLLWLAKQCDWSPGDNMIC